MARIEFSVILTSTARFVEPTSSADIYHFNYRLVHGTSHTYNMCVSFPLLVRDHDSSHSRAAWVAQPSLSLTVPLFTTQMAIIICHSHGLLLLFSLSSSFLLLTSSSFSFHLLSPLTPLHPPSFFFLPSLPSPNGSRYVATYQHTVLQNGPEQIR